MADVRMCGTCKHMNRDRFRTKYLKRPYHRTIRKYRCERCSKWVTADKYCLLWEKRPLWRELIWQLRQ